MLVKGTNLELTNSTNRLKKLKEKLNQQRSHLDELESHIKELEKEAGGGSH